MTPARKAALQWFHDRGEVEIFDASAPSHNMRQSMLKDGQIDCRSQGNFRLMLWSLTDKGRRMLHGDAA